MAVKIKKGLTSGSIDMTPMIDIVFQLMIFFLVAAKLEEQERELPIVLPRASEAQPLVAKPKELIVSIDREGRYFVAGQSPDIAGVENILRQAWTDNPGRVSVIIRADQDTRHRFVVAAMNACNKAGIRDYTIATADAGSGEPPDG